jgi:hypothetical protein
VYYNLKESIVGSGLTNMSPDGDPLPYDTVGSLRRKLFDKAPSTKRVGQLAHNKEIFEAVVAIPFTTTGNQKKFFPLVPANDAVVAKTKGQHVVQAILGTREPMNPTVYAPGHSIIDQVEKMQKYVFPPQLDFINNKSVTPMQMYVFEFNHVFDKEDLLDIWQGVMPKISRTAEKQSSSVTHFLTNNEILLGNPVDSNIRWMIFKVKQRASYNFTEMQRKSAYGFYYKYSQDQEQFVGEADTGNQRYSYNWPYDFFSLVELVKIDTGIQIGGNVPKTPPDITSGNIPGATDEEQEKTPDLAKNKEFTPADAKKVFLGQEYNNNSEQEKDAKMGDIGDIPII